MLKDEILNMVRILTFAKVSVLTQVHKQSLYPIA